MQSVECPICHLTAEGGQTTYQDAYAVRCKRCGDYLIAGMLMADFCAKAVTLTPEDRELASYLSAATRHATETGRRIALAPDNWRDIARSVRTIPPRQKQLKLFKVIAARSHGGGDSVPFDINLDYPLADAGSVEEAGFFLNDLVSDGYLAKGPIYHPPSYSVTMRGWKYHESVASKESGDSVSGSPSGIPPAGSSQRTVLKENGAPKVEWDVFICHATEDKEPFVRQLAEGLRLAGLRVWYDEFSLQVGDHLRRSIDEGLARSRFGVVVLSRHFFAKEWPQWELDGLAAREVAGRKVILPLWHEIDADEVRRFSPILADRVAIKTSIGFDGVVQGILRVIGRPSIRLGDISTADTETGKSASAKRRSGAAGDRIHWLGSLKTIGAVMVGLATIIGVLHQIGVFDAMFRSSSKSKRETKDQIRVSGSVAVKTNIAGVQVWIDDKSVGETEPGKTLIVTNVSIGTHVAKGLKTGYREWVREIEVMAQTTTNVSMDMEPLVLSRGVQESKKEEMVLVPAGEFWMGSTKEEVKRIVEKCKESGITEEVCNNWFQAETPRHRVTMSGFYLDRFEVTNALFGRFVEAQAYRTLAEREGWGLVSQQKGGSPQEDKVRGASWRMPTGSGSAAESTHPVVQVTWWDAQAYCEWIGKRLPTEAEWEKAARGPDGRKYPWGETWDPGKANGAQIVNTTTPVGDYRGGISPYGVHDLAGNVWEWVSSFYRPYPYLATDGREELNNLAKRVFRGGSWGSHPEFLRSATRMQQDPRLRDSTVGFRCARSA